MEKNISLIIPPSVGKRLKFWRKNDGLRLVDVAGLIKVSQGSLSDLENDKSLPSAVTLTGLCQKTELNICWLLTGDGVMKREKEVPVEDLPLSVNVRAWLQDREFQGIVLKLVQIFQNSSAEKRALIRGYIEGIDVEN